ncbi:MAG TPA: hypothetical protein ENI69_01885 [Rhodospirillales bacterium]|nr:hypothetical protein [Rhodospirillales bacterium]
MPANFSPDLVRLLADLRKREQSFAAGKSGSDEWAELQMRKWGAIHDLLVANPFTVRDEIERSDQWRRVRDHLAKLLNEPEITAWLTQQMDVANNLATGIHEMRPRKSGPCYEILMEWVVNRRAKTQAVSKWVRGQSDPNFPTFNRP